MTADQAVDYFNDWATTYDAEIGSWADDFPFAGYDMVLTRMADLIVQSGATRVLDLGVGTGNLAGQIAMMRPDIEIWGIDFSTKMLEQARRKVPNGEFIEADLARDLPRLALPRFGGIVASYVLHELPDDTKASLIEDLLRHRLEPGGLLVVCDIAFADSAQRAAIRSALADRWDQSEHYFAAHDFLQRLAARDIAGDYRHVSMYAGIFTFHGSDALLPEDQDMDERHTLQALSSMRQPSGKRHVADVARWQA
ncbi:MAG TPA: class I SAM-dependent methyltransferase [Thermomicrobiales bacterium]|nr:class I SAM-dependent methyltransferase [Thermomicrobiales bacterium]